jgi:hypothetical protein
MSKVEDNTSSSTNIFDQEYIELPDLEGFVKDIECEDDVIFTKKRVIFTKAWDGTFYWKELEPNWDC